MKKAIGENWKDDVKNQNGRKTKRQQSALTDLKLRFKKAVKDEWWGRTGVYSGSDVVEKGRDMQQEN